MDSELEEISLVGMSNSELQFQVEKEPNVIEFNILLRSTFQFSSDECLITSSSLSSEDYHDHQQGPELPQLKQEVEEDDDDEEVIKMRDASARRRTINGGELEVNEDDDGFRTPTSLDHRIPAVIHQCPPAPKKSKSSPKRKASSSSTRRQLFLVDHSQEIESLFTPALLADFGRKIKKVRAGDNDTK
ncbi:hypothetical protein NE237_010844 [Protea cynaroides]|uniref:Uncharacterized protein n=1 Tax=Protea cynaroides TaxID=273540 RepID=A0A9Q0L160_9MAGN|nr:hypothetical protein NE237_010844 [Protea cynaroides]